MPLPAKSKSGAAPHAGTAGTAQAQAKTASPAKPAAGDAAKSAPKKSSEVLNELFA